MPFTFDPKYLQHMGVSQTLIDKYLLPNNSWGYLIGITSKGATRSKWETARDSVPELEDLSYLTLPRDDAKEAWRKAINAFKGSLTIDVAQDMLVSALGVIPGTKDPAVSDHVRDHLRKVDITEFRRVVDGFKGSTPYAFAELLTKLVGVAAAGGKAIEYGGKALHHLQHLFAAERVARRFQAALSDQLEDKMQRFLAKPLDAAEGKEIAHWLQTNFFFLGTKTPKGQKDLKESVNKLHWFLAHGISQSMDPERLRATVEAEWQGVQKRLGDLAKHFSEEGGKSVPKEIKVGGNTYLNISGFYEDDLMKFVKRLEAVFDMLKGWRKKALSGGVTVALAGPKDFRGTSRGKYKSADDVLYVRATPDVLKRSGGNYGSFEYIIVHELGHRYDYKVHRPSVDFDKPEWWTSRYSRNEGESFAELFALSNFGTTGQGDPEKLDRFEALMAGKDEQPKPEIPEHLKKYRTQPTF